VLVSFKSLPAVLITASGKFCLSCNVKYNKMRAYLIGQMHFIVRPVTMVHRS